MRDIARAISVRLRSKGTDVTIRIFLADGGWYSKLQSDIAADLSPTGAKDAAERVRRSE